MTAPALSVIVVGFDMDRELPRTVLSLLPPYQRDVAAQDIEIIVADNNSTTPIRRDQFPVDANVTVIRVEDGGVSPCRAINRAAALARGDLIAVVIDGARMVSPGMVSTALLASRLHPLAFIATLGFHLGPKVQQVSVTEGYDRAVEDALLAQIGWPEDGYRLFEISALGESYSQGVLASPPETTFFTMNRLRFLQLGGFDERFTSLGGGFANFDMFERALEHPQAALVLLVGEATFHQLHYGATTREGGIRRLASTGDGSLADHYNREYEAIRGRTWAKTSRRPHLFGQLTHTAVLPLFFPFSPA